MLLRRVWPSRPAFDNPFADFGQLRREMQRMFDAFDGVREPQAGVFRPMNVTQDNDNFYVRAEMPRWTDPWLRYPASPPERRNCRCLA